MELAEDFTKADSAVVTHDAVEYSKMFSVASGIAVVFSAVCPGKTTANEDVAVLFPIAADEAIFAVADGAGGMSAGREAAEATAKALVEQVQGKVAAEGELRAGVLDGFEQASMAIRGWGLGAGTTLAVAQVSADTFRCYHVGDSFVLVVGQRGKVKYQTVSHSPVGYGVESGYLDEKEALFHDERHVVSNLVGLEDMRVEVGSPIRLSARDTVLIASDGLSDNLHLDEIVECIRKGPLDKCAGNLTELSRSRMELCKDGEPSKPDDLTFILFRQSDRKSFGNSL